MIERGAALFILGMVGLWVGVTLSIIIILFN